VGQSVVYEEGSELLKQLMGVEISAPQIQRVCVHYGSKIAQVVQANCTSVLPRLQTREVEPDPVYVMVDGSMLHIREEQWRGLKLGRVFQDNKIVQLHSRRRAILESVYVNHLGSVEEFFPKLERHLVGYHNKVILADGANWIWKWAEDNYPGATQILDFYHAKEKLVIFARHQFKDEQTRQN